MNSHPNTSEEQACCHRPARAARTHPCLTASPLPPLPCPRSPLPALLSLQWAAFPLLQLAFQAGDIKALLDNRTVGATMHGATDAERATGARAPALVPGPARPSGWLPG